MSAVAARTTLAAIGRDLTMATGGRSAHRAAALGSSVGAQPPTAFASLAQVPEWLRFPAKRRAALARLVALRSIAPSLAASIDGAWLGAIAEVTGEPALDWAISSASAPTASVVGGTRPTPDELVQIGMSILAAQLPPMLRCYLSPATRAPDANPVTIDPAVIDEALAFMRLDGA